MPKKTRRKAAELDGSEIEAFSVICNDPEPIFYEEAINGPESEQWRKATQEEYVALIVKFVSLRILFALSARIGLDIDHVDIDSAYLHGQMPEEIYIEQPEGFVNAHARAKVCRLKKAIYGTKQVRRVWHGTIRQFLLQLGFHQSIYDQCIFYKIEGDTIIIVTLFVDDILVFYNSKKLLTDFKNALGQRFPIKELGNPDLIFGMRVTYDKNEGVLSLDQTDYIDLVLRECEMLDCKHSNIPIERNEGLDTPEQTCDPKLLKKKTRIPYRRTIGRLMYIMVGSRPDLAYALSTLSKYCNNFTLLHWEMLKKLLRYLAGTRHLKLVFTRDGKSQISGFADASWAKKMGEYKSVSGYVFLMQGAAISWKSRRQDCVSKSTSEAEYVSSSEASSEAIWLRNLCMELKIIPETSVEMFCDNKSAIELAKNGNFSARTRHIAVAYHFVKEKIEMKIVHVEYLPTKDMIADMLTKPATPDVVRMCVLGMCIK